MFFVIDSSGTELREDALADESICAGGRDHGVDISKSTAIRQDHFANDDGLLDCLRAIGKLPYHGGRPAVARREATLGAQAIDLITRDCQVSGKARIDDSEYAGGTIYHYWDRVGELSWDLEHGNNAAVCMRQDCRAQVQTFEIGCNA